MKTEKLEIIDYFKGIGVAMILVVHAAQKFGLPEWARLIPRFCQMGCQLFLVISVFCLCISFSNKQPAYFDYIKRRFVRIGSGYWLAILLYLLAAVMSRYLYGWNIFQTDTELTDVVINVFLLNGLVPTSANNSVVRGGWFVGTIFLFYLIFPILWKVYNISSKCWIKCRRVCFPAIIQIMAFICVCASTFFGEGAGCQNNRFIYFSLINQLPCLSLGFVLFDIYSNKELHTIRFSLQKGIILILADFILFYSNTYYAFVFVPSVFGLGFVYVYIYMALINENHTQK